MREYDAYNLNEFYKILASDPFELKDNYQQPIWFRGHEFNHYNLQPSMQREFLPESNSVNTNNQLVLREFYRYQNFAARTTHCVNSNISSKLEWQEVYQHHLGKTRLMDWSESARTALSFALESYLTPKDSLDLSNKRKVSTPVVWMLNPKKLNEKVFDFLVTDTGKEASIYVLKDMGLSDTEAKNIINKMYSEKNIYFAMNDKNDKSIEGILSLCVLDNYRTSNMSRIKDMVKNMEFNPFYYICLRYYSDAFPADVKDGKYDVLPPLAVLQPYHSERIRAQRGAFTIFPNYTLSQNAKKLYDVAKHDVRKMENQINIQDCLVKINLLNPIKIARSLILSGERRSELYPDVDVYTELIESEKFYI